MRHNGGMPRATFPSPAFPAYPALSVNKPQGWVELAAVGLPLAIAADVPGKQFRPNVLVTMARHGVDHSIQIQVVTHAYLSAVLVLVVVEIAQHAWHA